MKKLLLSAMALLPLAAMAQKPFTLTGNLKTLKNGDKIYLVYAENGARKTDSALVANGSFAFKGIVTEPTQANLFKNINPFIKGADTRNMDYTALYIEPGNLIVSSVDSIKNVTISGSAVNDEDKKLKALTKPVNDQLVAINTEFSKLTPEQQKDPKIREEIGSRFDKATEALTPILLAYAKNNPKSYISLLAIGQLAVNPDLLQESEKAFNGLTPALKDSKAGKQFAQIFDAAKKTAVGTMAMDFTQNDADGKPVKLSDFKGKYVLVDFWASWCGPCRQENPNVVAAYNKFKDKGFTVLGVSLDQPGKKDAWLKAIADDKLAWTQVSDLKFWNNEVAVMYGIRSIPANFLIDPTGKIVAKGLREEALHSKLEELLGGKSK